MEIVPTLTIALARTPSTPLIRYVFFHYLCFPILCMLFSVLFLAGFLLARSWDNVDANTSFSCILWKRAKSTNCCLKIKKWIAQNLEGVWTKKKKLTSHAAWISPLSNALQNISSSFSETNSSGTLCECKHICVVIPSWSLLDCQFIEDKNLMLSLASIVNLSFFLFD